MLYKTTIVIWTDYDPECEIEDLAREATNGNAYCSRQTSEVIWNPEDDDDWDGNEFFKDLEEES